jgi:hypothetical protein
MRQPVRGSAGPAVVFVLDASRSGLRVAHRTQLPDAGAICKVELPSSNGPIHLDCAIVHTSIQHANAAAESVFHSGLRIMTPNAPIESLLQAGEEED